MIKVVCGVIGNEAGEVLACLRPEGKHLAGLWEFPGGKVDEGEKPEDALIRELREELSVEVEILDSLAEVIWNYGDRTIQLLPFRCRIIGGTLQATEHEEVLWCSAEAAAGLAWAEADLPVLDEVFMRKSE